MNSTILSILESDSSIIWLMSAAAFLITIVFVVSLDVVKLSNLDGQAKKLESEKADLARREHEHTERVNEDIFTPFRKKLAGHWEMSFTGWRHTDADGTITSFPGTLDAEFTIEPVGQKMRLQYNIPRNEWHIGQNVMVEAVGLWPPPDPDFLTYLVELHLIGTQGKSFNGKVFVHTQIVKVDGDPIKLDGIWYDLDGAFSDVDKQTPPLPPRGKIVFKRKETYWVPAKT